jgi:DNA-binding transcriptional LysR family regulator
VEQDLKQVCMTGTRLFNLAHREADIAFRVVPLNTADVVQRRLFRLDYGIYLHHRGVCLIPNMATERVIG